MSNSPARFWLRLLKRLLRSTLQLLTIGLGLILAAIVLLWLAGLLFPAQVKPQQWLKQIPVPAFSLPNLKQPRLVLLMGVDTPYFKNTLGYSQKADDPFKGARTDTMLIVRLDPARQSAGVVSIPRDSKVYLPNGRVGKVNSAHAHGGPRATLRTLRQNLGLPISDYITVDLSAVKEVVDALGGLDLTIHQAMYYRDETDGLVIELDPGRHHLNGLQIQQFIRFRQDAYGDIGRIERQQAVMNALQQKLSSSALLTALPSLLTTINKSLRTNLTHGELLAMANFTRSLPSSRLQFSTLPGHASSSERVSYWIVNPRQARRVLEEVLYSTEEVAPVDEDFRVGILYHRSANTLATQLHEALERAGYRNDCQQVFNVKHSQWVEHQSPLQPGQRDDIKALLKPLWPSVQELGSTVSLVNSTYIQNYCSPKEKLTLLLGPQVNTL